MRLLLCTLALIPVAVIGTGMYARLMYAVCLAVDFEPATATFLTGLIVSFTVLLIVLTLATKAIDGYWWWHKVRL